MNTPHLKTCERYLLPKTLPFGLQCRRLFRLRPAFIALILQLFVIQTVSAGWLSIIGGVVSFGAATAFASTGVGLPVAATISIAQIGAISTDAYRTLASLSLPPRPAQFAGPAPAAYAA